MVSEDSFHAGYCFVVSNAIITESYLADQSVEVRNNFLNVIQSTNDVQLLSFQARKRPTKISLFYKKKKTILGDFMTIVNVFYLSLHFWLMFISIYSFSTHFVNNISQNTMRDMRHLILSLFFISFFSATEFTSIFANFQSMQCNLNFGYISINSSAPAIFLCQRQKLVTSDIILLNHNQKTFCLQALG